MIIVCNQLYKLLTCYTGKSEASASLKPAGEDSNTNTQQLTDIQYYTI